MQLLPLEEANTIISIIAEHFNLLAMIATIEASHGGEAGKAFSVFADEIRKLSETPTSQSKMIGEQISKIGGMTQNIVSSSRYPLWLLGHLKKLLMQQILR